MNQIWAMFIGGLLINVSALGKSYRLLIHGSELA
jgi:hypothetical protein